MTIVELRKANDFNDWIERMKETGYPGIHSDNSLILFFVSLEGDSLYHNGVESGINSNFVTSLDKPGRNFYTLEYIEEK